MAYLSYPPYYQQYPQPNFSQSQYQMQANNNERIWVQGETGAKSYLVAPNATVELWDSDAPVIYLKSADANGMPSMKILDYTTRGETRPRAAVVDDVKFATKEDIEDLAEQIASIQKRVDGLSTKKQTSRKEVDSDE